MSDEPSSVTAERDIRRQLREMNEALLLSSVRQHELTELAQQAEDASHKSEVQLRFVMDSMPQKIFTATPIGDVDYFNPQWTEFTGLSFEQIKGWGWRQFIHPDDLEETVQHWTHCVETVERFQFEHRFRRADGGYHWHFSRALPMRDETGRVLMWVGSNTDIEEIKQAQKKTQEQAAALADLHRRKDEFLAMLSHELRNPLAPIANAVQLLRLAPNDAPLQQQARTIIERQVGQLTRLVDDLMEVSRITTGRVQLRLERVVVNGIVERAVESARPLIDHHEHELTVSLSPEPIWLYADAARLEQVVMNLLTNAAKYTKEGGRISLSVEVGAASRAARDDTPEKVQLGSRNLPEVLIRIRDTGVGIAPAILPRIFDLFTQADRSLDRSQGGLGIGLALVQRLVDMHGGTVEASSALGRGSEFIVRLPVAPPPERQPVSPPTEQAQPTGPSLRVLVVDDNVDTATTLAMLVQESGHEVRTAHDGSTVLQAALEYRPNVVLLDIGLPGLDGFEVAKRIRQQPALQNVVLVALTGYGQETDRQRSREAGFDHHLVKPGDFAKVLQILATVSESQAKM